MSGGLAPNVLFVPCFVTFQPAQRAFSARSTSLPGNRHRLCQPLLHLFRPSVTCATAGGRAAFPSKKSKHSSAQDVEETKEPMFAADLKASVLASDAVTHRSSNRRRRFSLIGLLFLSIIYVFGTFFLLLLLLAHPVVMLLDRHRRRFHDLLGWLWMKCCLLSVGIVPEVVDAHNLPPPGMPCIFVANHSSNMDVFALAFLDRAVKCVVKSDVFKMPVIGWAIWLAGNIGVNRSSRKGHVEAFQRMVTALKHGVALIVYPEGTRSETGRLAHFKPGAFRAAKQAAVPIVPITVTGTRDMMPSFAYVPLRYPPVRFRLVVHPMLDPHQYTTEELRNLAFRAIDSKLDPSLQSVIHTS